MLDLLFAVAILGLPIAAIVVSRSAALVAILMAAGFGVSGVALQFVGIMGGELTYRPLQVWVTVTLVAVLVIAVALRGEVADRLSRSGVWLIVGSSAVIAVAFITSRLLAPGSPAPLSGVGYLIERPAAEDNAKWLNVASQLAAGTSVDPRANVGGPLVLVMVVTATLISVASFLLYGAVNQIAVASGTLILAEFMLVVIAPFALAPLIQAVRRWHIGSARSRLPWPLLLLGIVILGSGVAVLLALGHLTLQYTILVLALWVSTFLVGWRTGQGRVLATIAVVCTAEVWFPLNILAVGLIAALLAWSIAGLARRRPMARVYAGTLAVTAVVTVLMYDFLRSSIGYALGLDGGQVSTTAALEQLTTSGGGVHGVAVGAIRGIVHTVTTPTLPLFASQGGTEEITTLLAAITIVAVIGAIVVLNRDRTSWRAAVPFAPIATLGVYTVVVTLADFWAIGYGPNYASKKLTFGVVIPILAATVPVALTALDRPERRMTLLRWAALGGVVALLVIDTLVPRALTQLKPGLWPSASGDPGPYWWPAEVRATGDQPLDKNPIGCIYLPQGATEPSVLTNGPRAYSCTRILTGLAGLGTSGAALVQWQLDEWLQNTSLWDHYHQYLELLPTEVRARQVILLDDEDHVVGLESLQSLLDRFPADATVDATP